jgi:hypothetical protein
LMSISKGLTWIHCIANAPHPPAVHVRTLCEGECNHHPLGRQPLSWCRHVNYSSHRCLLSVPFHTRPCHSLVSSHLAPSHAILHLFRSELHKLNSLHPGTSSKAHMAQSSTRVTSAPSLPSSMLWPGTRSCSVILLLLLLLHKFQLHRRICLCRLARMQSIAPSKPSISTPPASSRLIPLTAPHPHPKQTL